MKSRSQITTGCVMACVIMAMLAARCTGDSTDDWNELSDKEEPRMCRTKQGAQAQFGSGQCFSDLSGAWKYRSGQSTPAWGARMYALAIDLAFDPSVDLTSCINYGDEAGD